MKSPFFSVIIPTYQRAELLRRTLKSFTEQTFPDFEVIVVDDGGTDHTREVVESFQDTRFRYYWKENEERGAARNFGARLARGVYLNFFDSDDIAYPHHLETAKKVVEERDHPFIFHLHYEIEQANSKRTKPKLSSLLNSALLRGNPLSCNGVFLRRDIALEFPFSEERIVAGSEDYLLWLELAAHFPIIHISIATSLVCYHEGRSVLIKEPERLIQRKMRMLQLAKGNEAIQRAFGSRFHILEATTYTYIALHLVLGGFKTKALPFLWKGIQTWPGVFTTRRFYAILKHLILS